MGIEQKQTFRVTCNRHGCYTSIEYDSWSEVEEKQFATDGGFSSIYVTRFGPFQDFPEDWERKYIGGYDGRKYYFYCPACSKRMKDEENQRKEEAERNRAKNLRKVERYKRVTQ